MWFVNQHEFLPDGFVLLQDNPDTYQLSSELQIAVITGEAHALDVDAIRMCPFSWQTGVF